MIIATLYKSVTGKGFGGFIEDTSTGHKWTVDEGWTRQQWREQARARGYGRKGSGQFKLREVRYVSAYPQHAALIASFDGTEVAEGPQQRVAA